MFPLSYTYYKSAREGARGAMGDRCRMDSGVEDADSGCHRRRMRLLYNPVDRILKHRTDRIKIVTPIRFLTEYEVR
jgi:hypothetical protein